MCKRGKILIDKKSFKKLMHLNFREPNIKTPDSGVFILGF